jgi:hypothetical protein
VSQGDIRFIFGLTNYTDPNMKDLADDEKRDAAACIIDGAEAYQQGYPLSACPFNEETHKALWTAWRFQWLQAEEFDKQAIRGKE